MKRSLFILSATILIASCTSKVAEQDLIGSWVEPIPGMQGVQGVKIEEGGTARSINMSTLVYEHWQLEGSSLILSGQSIGNGQTISFTDTLGILKADKDNLVLTKGELRIAYRRLCSDERPIAQDTVRGTITFAHEVRTFQPQGDTAQYWLTDTSGYLQKLYVESGKPEWKVDAELIVRNMGKSEEGFAADYDSAYQLIQVVELKEL